MKTRVETPATRVGSERTPHGKMNGMSLAAAMASDEAPTFTTATFKHVVLEETLDCTPALACERLESPSFVFQQKANDGAKQVRLSAWQQGERTKWRACTYVTGAAGDVAFFEMQRVCVLPDSGDAVLVCVFAAHNMPYASYFCARVKYVLSAMENGGAKLHISADVPFLKKTMLSGQIESAVLKEVRTSPITRQSHRISHDDAHLSFTPLRR